MIATLVAALSINGAAWAASDALTSPDGRIKLEIGGSGWSVSFGGKQIVKNGQSQIRLTDGTSAWPEGSISINRKLPVKEHITAPLYRQSAFDYEYNQYKADFGNGFSIEWRISNDGVAYRFATSRESETTVAAETFTLEFAEDKSCIGSYVQNPSNPYHSSFENTYSTRMISEGSDVPSFLPFCVNVSDDIRLTVLESDHEAYPGMFIRPVRGSQKIAAEFAPYFGQTAFIANSKGPRTYPWRILKITDDDTQLPVDNLVYALAGPSRVEDESWIRPGYCSWDWWNDWQLEGVDFTPGINTRTYEYYIDFAAAFGLEYVLLDEGWGKHNGRNTLTPNADVDLEHLVKYAADKGVRLILWTMVGTICGELESACGKYEKMGIAGFKCDFLDRNDQQGVSLIYRIAEVAARHHMVVDFHGIYPPAGMERTYPNILNFEGVWGLENAKDFHTQELIPYDVTIPYLRNMYGICDYTPGAMINFTKEKYMPSKSHPGSPGTRARQAALYVVLDSPIEMMCDSPTNYYKEKESASFIASLPRKYESKKVLSGKLGEWIVVARENEGAWYVGGMTDWTARDVEVDFSFLGRGKWAVEAFLDGAKAAEDACDYSTGTFTVCRKQKKTIHLAPGGGFVLKISKL